MTMRICLVFVCGCAIAACASGPTPTTPAPMPTPMPTPAATPMPTNAADAPTASASTTSNGGPPPSGFYRYALHVVSDDCTPATQNVEKQLTMVFARTTSKGLVLNVPLVVTGSTVARSDIEATVGTTVHHVTKNAACPGADVRRTLVVKDVSRTLFVLDETLEHMDASSCAPPGPKACTTRAEIRLTLEEAKCEATCGATVDMTKSPPQFVCKCP